MSSEPILGISKYIFLFKPYRVKSQEFHSLRELQIWANIQPVDQPSRVSFDFNNTSKWKPFFHKGFPHPGLSSVQVSQKVILRNCVSYITIFSPWMQYTEAIVSLMCM